MLPPLDRHTPAGDISQRKRDPGRKLSAFGVSRTWLAGNARQVVCARTRDFPVSRCSSTHCAPCRNSRKCCGRPSSRPLSGSPRASRACARPTISRLSRVSASAASLTGIPPSARETASSRSSRLAAVGCVMIAAAPRSADPVRHAGSPASVDTNSIAAQGLKTRPHENRLTGKRAAAYLRKRGAPRRGHLRRIRICVSGERTKIRSSSRRCVRTLGAAFPVGGEGHVEACGLAR